MFPAVAERNNVVAVPLIGSGDLAAGDVADAVVALEYAEFDALRNGYVGRCAYPFRDGAGHAALPKSLASAPTIPASTSSTSLLLRWNVSRPIALSDWLFAV